MPIPLLIRMGGQVYNLCNIIIHSITGNLKSNVTIKKITNKMMQEINS